MGRFTPRKLFANGLGKSKRRKKKAQTRSSTKGWLTAEKADILELYERSVQEPEAEMDLIDQVWKELRNRSCHRIRQRQSGGTSNKLTSRDGVFSVHT